jgi:hypothetical protein
VVGIENKRPVVRVKVRVDGTPWEQVRALEDCGPDERVYLVSIAEDGVTRMEFGDGSHGSRLPSGVKCVSTTYRVGLGATGNVSTGEDTNVPSRTGVHLIYLDVWTREITALQDPQLLDAAMGGPDTSIRNNPRTG